MTSATPAADPPLILLDSSYARELDRLCVPWQAAPVTEPRLLALNGDLARELGLDPDVLGAPEGTAFLVGNAVPEGASPVAQAYAGHQFGGYSPRLGDGRALLLGEVIDANGSRRDLHLKGSGRTPFARGGDGKAAVGPMLREYLIGEAMHAFGVPTSRALAVVATGEPVARETMLPGAVLTRVAASHLRVGTFEYATRLNEPGLLQQLADYAIARHYPDAAEAENPYVAFFEQVADAQASLVASWMHIGFIHGVMNTDNMSISGETIDYGPCAFMEEFDPATVFSSIDHGGRYAYGNQPAVAQWNLARLAETLLGLIDEDTDAALAKATEMVHAFPGRYQEHWSAGMRAKLGFAEHRPGDEALIDDLLALMADQKVDYTACLRALSSSAVGDDAPAKALFSDPPAFDTWADRWRERLAAEAGEAPEIAAAMNRVNPAFIPRNHIVEAALTAATAGDLGPFEELMGVIAAPYDERPGLSRYAEPAPPGFGSYQTFCGT